MHQLQYNRSIDVKYEGLDKKVFQKFNKTCVNAKIRHVHGLQLRDDRHSQLIVIRNKYTKEIVDLEVRGSNVW